jgi:iron(III) transport system ATP-binding protein
MIILTDVSKHFGPARQQQALSEQLTVHAVRDVSLTLAEGSRTVIQGPSGSGKTTLLRLIAGLERPSAGEIRIDGEIVSTPDWVLPSHQRDMGFVFQDPALWPHLTVAQNIGFGLLGLPKQEIALRVADVLASMDLAGLQRRYPNQLSGGQARRVAIARTLVVNPRRLLLDEPLTHLQSELKAQLLAVIRDQVAARAMTLLYVTHSVDEAAYLGGARFQLVDGHLAALKP